MSSSLDATDGHPIFLEVLPVQLGAYFTEVSAFAAFRGSRMRGTDAEMAAFASAGFAQLNDLWVNTTDDITYLYSGGWKPWESNEFSFDPTWSGLTPGTGATNTGRYWYSSGKVKGRTETVLSSGFTIGATRLTPPVAIATPADSKVGGGNFTDSGTGYNDAYLVRSGSNIAVMYLNTTTGRKNDLTSVLPFAWASGDKIYLEFEYEV